MIHQDCKIESGNGWSRHLAGGEHQHVVDSDNQLWKKFNMFFIHSFIHLENLYSSPSEALPVQPR